MPRFSFPPIAMKIMTAPLNKMVDYGIQIALLDDTVTNAFTSGRHRLGTFDANSQHPFEF